MKQVNRDYRDGQIVIQGASEENLEEFYLLLSGKLVVEYSDRTSGQVRQELGPNAFFGLVSPLLGVPRTATVRAVGNAQVRAFVVESPDASLEIARMDAATLAKLLAHLAWCVHERSTERL